MSFMLEQRYQEAISALRNEDYQKAEDLLIELIHLDVRSPDVFVALGNVYYRQGNLNKAYGTYVQGAFQNPRNEDLRHNIQIVSEKLQASPLTLHWFSFEESCVLTSSCVGVLFVAVLLHRWKWSRWIALCAMFGMIVFFGFSCFLWQQQKNGIVVQQTYARSMRQKGVDLYTLNVGECVTLKERDNKYWLVEHIDNGTGWIAEQTVMPLNPNKNGEAK